MLLSCEQHLCIQVNLSTDDRSNQSDIMKYLYWENGNMNTVHVFVGSRVMGM